jgi:Membrane-bound toxin component of toxin-antitoxin system
LSQNFDSKLILNINVSHALTGILLLTHLGGIILVALIPLAWAIRAGIWALLGWSLYCSLRLHARRNARTAIKAVELDEEGALAVRFAGMEQWRNARITAWLVHPWLTLVALRIDGGIMPVNLAIAADAVEAEAFRRWRARLKLRIAAV